MTRRRRRLLILNQFAAAGGEPGGTRHIELASRLKGWDPIIVTGRRGLMAGTRTTLDDPRIRTVWVSSYQDNGPRRILNWASYAVTAFLAGVRMPRPDLVYASTPHLLTPLVGWMLARLRGIPFVMEVRDLWPDVLVDMGQLTLDSLLFRLLRALEQFLYQRADAVVVLAHGSRDHLIEEGIPAGKITVVPNGSDVDFFLAPAPRDVLRSRFGFSGIVAVYAGAHGPANGLDLLLDAARAVSDDVPDLNVVLVGDGIAKQKLVARARRDGLTNVCFLDPVPKKEMPALLGAADMGVHVLADVPLFRYGVSPNKLFDYMAAGLPVITNTPGEVAGIVEEARAGIAVAPDDLAAGLRAVAGADRAQREAWGAAGRSYLSEHRSRDRLAERVEQVLDEVMAKSGL
jgi:glycosyltransferase involved in cell wall biosynthesis